MYNFWIVPIEYYLCSKFHVYMTSLSKVIEGGLIHPPPPPGYLRPKRPGSNMLKKKLLNIFLLFLVLEEMPPFPERESSLLAKLKKKKGGASKDDKDIEPTTPAAVTAPVQQPVAAPRVCILKTVYYD